MNNKNVTEFFNWAAENDNFRRDSIGDDFVLIENPGISPCLNKPFKVDVFAGILCTKGYMKGTVNLKQYEANGPFIFVVLPGSGYSLKAQSVDLYQRLSFLFYQILTLLSSFYILLAKYPLFC